MKGSVAASCNGQALEGGPGRVSQQGQKLLPCPSLLQHSSEEVWRPAVSRLASTALQLTDVMLLANITKAGTDVRLCSLCQNTQKASNCTKVLTQHTAVALASFAVSIPELTY